MMKTAQFRVTKLRRIAFAVPIAALLVGPPVIADAEEGPFLASPPQGAALTDWAMNWFTEAMAGRINRLQYSATFAPQVTDEAVAKMASDLNKYGASPLRAEIVQTKKDGEQRFYVLKFVFPRGDATSLLFGFDARGKITGIAVGGMAGD